MRTRKILAFCLGLCYDNGSVHRGMDTGTEPMRDAKGGNVMTKEDLMQISELMDQKLDQKFEVFEQKMDQKMDQKLDALEKRIDQKMDQKIDALRDEMETMMDRKIEGLRRDTETMMEDKIRGVKILIENDVSKRIDALFDGYKLVYEKQHELETRLSIVEAKVG